MDSLLGGLLVIALAHAYFSNFWDRLYERIWGRKKCGLVNLP